MTQQTREWKRRGWIGLIGVALVMSALAADAEGFIPVKPEKLRKADGAVLKDGPAAAGWRWLPNQGNDGLLEAVPGEESAILMMWVDGLVPGAQYEVHGGFWVDLVGEEAGDRVHGAAQFGVAMAEMHPFDGAEVSNERWLVVPGSKVGASYGHQVVLADKLTEETVGMRVEHDAGWLACATVGLAKADRDGKLPVFFADYRGFSETGSALIDGVWVRRADDMTAPLAGWQPKTSLHRALRAGDAITFERVLESGADVNALDEDGLTPLFYAVAASELAIVHKLMSAGASAEVEGQSLSPLVASASISSVELTRLLLDAGAIVTTMPPEDSGALAINQDPRYIHPVMVAVRAGSVPVLKLLLDHAPQLDLQQLVTIPENHKARSRSYNTIFHVNLTRQAMDRGHWEMAALLLENGYVDPNRREPINRGEMQMELANVVLRSGPESMPLVETMLKLGYPPVQSVDSKQKVKADWIMDALSAAVYTGRVDLVRRFLPLVDGQRLDYLGMLGELAVSGGDTAVITMLTERYPDAMPGPLAPAPVSGDKDVVEAVPPRLFLPRTSPPVNPPPGEQRGSHTMAVISSPEASGPASSLVATASKLAGWKVVDREVVEAALQESKWSKPWQDGEYELAELGDQLAADCLVIVSRTQVHKLEVYRFELVEVSTGLEVHREHFRSDSFEPEADLAAFAMRAAAALDAAAENHRHQAVTLLTFPVNGQLADSLALSQIMRAAVRREVDSTPGFITMSRAQSARLVEEQALVGQNTVWAASHLIEGGISPTGNNGVRVELRLDTIRDGKSSRTDVAAEGGVDELAVLVGKLWQQLLEKAGAVPQETSPEYVQSSAKREAGRLLREAQWLLSLKGNPDEIQPMVEAAFALGAPMEKVIPLHLDVLCRKVDAFIPSWDAFDMGRPRLKLDGLYEEMRLLPVTLATSDAYVAQLPLARRLLHQASWYLSRHGKSYLDQDDGSSGKKIWQVIQMLTYMRAAVVESRLDAAGRDSFAVFADELDGLVGRYFAVLSEIEHPPEFLYQMDHMDEKVLSRNPALVANLADLATTSAPLRSLMGYVKWREDRGYALLARKIIERIGNDPSPYLQYKKADLECLLAGTHEAAAAVRRLVEAAIKLNQCKKQDFGQIQYWPVSRDVVDDHSTSYFFHRFWPKLYIYHDTCTLPTLLHTPRPAPDHYLKFTHYLFGSNDFRLLGNDRQSNTTMYGDSFRRQYGGYITPGFGDAPDGSVRRSRVRRAEFTAVDKNTALLELICGKVKESANKEDPRRTAPIMTAELAADLRGDYPVGMAIWPLADRADPSRLWIHYFPSVNKDVPIGGWQFDGKPWTKPQLLAVDCSNGDVVHRIDLLKQAGPMSGRGAVGDPCSIWRMSLDQTLDHLMINVGERSFLVDKQSGRMDPLPDRASAREGKFDFGFLRVGVAGVGDHFYFLDHANLKNGGAVTGSGGLSVFEVGADLKVRPITVKGRRPEKTPFDAIDREPRALTEHNGRLAVANESILAYYDPASGKWSEEVEAEPKYRHMFPIHEDHFWPLVSS